MISRVIVPAAAIVAGFFIAFAPSSAQARMFDPALNAATPSGVEQVQYRRHHRHWRHHQRRHRHCWNDRVRVRTPAGVFVYRIHRRCGWRSW